MNITAISLELCQGTDLTK